MFQYRQRPFNTDSYTCHGSDTPLQVLHGSPIPFPFTAAAKMINWKTKSYLNRTPDQKKSVPSLIRGHKTYSWNFQVWGTSALHPRLNKLSSQALQNVTATTITWYREPNVDTQRPKPFSTRLEQVNHSTATEDPQQDPEPMWLQKRFTEPEKQQQQSWLSAKSKEINRTEPWKISPPATEVRMSKYWSINWIWFTYLWTD